MLINVDLPSPDSPRIATWFRTRESGSLRADGDSSDRLTDNHGSELESFADTFPVHLVWQVREADVSA